MLIEDGKVKCPYCGNEKLIGGFKTLQNANNLEIYLSCDNGHEFSISFNTDLNEKVTWTVYKL